MPIVICIVSGAMLIGALLPAQAGVITERRLVTVDPAHSGATLVETGWFPDEGPGGLTSYSTGSRSLGEVQLGGEFELATTTYLYFEDWMGRPLETPIQEDWYSFENLALTGLEGLPELALFIDAWPTGASEIYGSDDFCERPRSPFVYATSFAAVDFFSIQGLAARNAYSHRPHA